MDDPPRFPGDPYDRAPEDGVINCRCEMIPVVSEKKRKKMEATFIGGPQDGLQMRIGKPEAAPPLFFFYTTILHPAQIHLYAREYRGSAVVFCYAGLSDPQEAIRKVLTLSKGRARKPGTP